MVVPMGPVHPSSWCWFPCKPRLLEPWDRAGLSPTLFKHVQCLWFRVIFKKKNTQTFQKLSVDVPTPCAPRASGSALVSPSPPSARGDGWSWREPGSDLHEGKWSLDVAVARGAHRAGAEPWVPG